MSIETVYNAVLEGNAPQADAATKAALAAGLAPDAILKEGCIAAMGEVGRLFEEGEMFVPEMLVAARAMQRSMAVLKPLLTGDSASSVAKAVVGTVKGDLHDIGKNLVKMMLQTAGFEVVDLGVDVEPKGFVDAIKGNNSNVLALSALLTTSMPVMKQTIDAVAEAGLRGNVKILIGGAPVTKQFADQIGADGYAADAGSASMLLKRLLG